MTLLRRVLGDALRGRRLRQRRTLREVSGAARVSLGYLSEVERGQKEASSELLAAICDALDVRMSELMGEVSDTLRRGERAEDVAGLPARPLLPAAAGRGMAVGRDSATLPVPAELAGRAARELAGHGARRAVAAPLEAAKAAAAAAARRGTPVGPELADEFDLDRLTRDDLLSAEDLVSVDDLGSDGSHPDGPRPDAVRVGGFGRDGFGRDGFGGDGFGRDRSRVELDGIDLAELETGDGLLGQRLGHAAAGEVERFLELTDLTDVGDVDGRRDGLSAQCRLATFAAA